MDNKKIGSGCGVMIINDNKLLMGLRSIDIENADNEMHEEGTWCIPGGNIEYGETFFEAGKREVKEETDLDIDVNDLELFCVQTDLNEYNHYISVGMLCKNYSGQVKVMEPDQIVCWEWIDLDNLPENIFSPSKKTIECYLKKQFFIP